MATTERKPFLLDFEKPLADLEARIDQIRELAAENGVDVSEEIRQLETRAVQLPQEIFSGCPRGAKPREFVEPIIELT